MSSRRRVHTCVRRTQPQREVVADVAAYSLRAESLLSAHTLVLNRHWVAVGVTRAKRAIGLVFVDSARVLSPDTYALHDFDSWTRLSRDAPREKCVRSVRLTFQVPEIILLTNYGGTPKAGVAFSRRNLCIRDRYTCQFCGIRLESHDLTIDHVLPRSPRRACHVGELRPRVRRVQRAQG